LSIEWATPSGEQTAGAILSNNASQRTKCLGTNGSDTCAANGWPW
jgi:hypothetical protein